MFTPDNVPLKKDKGATCDKCREVPSRSWCLYFPELEGQPLVCSRCVYEALVGYTAPDWRK
jgi:hypothetical protein